MRKCVKDESLFEERLLAATREARELARRLPPGRKREMLLRSASENEIAAQINKWINSSGLKPPN